MRHLIPHFITEKAKGEASNGSFMAHAIFLDISGFTNLTEFLFREAGREGGEVMSRILNNIFQPLVDMVYRKGGFIPYFAGDAFTGIFPDSREGIVAEELADMALGIQEAFTEWTETYKDREFPIRLKIGLSHGRVDWGIIGKQHKGFYFKGPAIDNSAACEHQAKVGDVIVDGAFLEQCVDDASHFTCKKMDEGYYKVLDSTPNPEHNVHVDVPVLEEEELYPFLPQSVIHYNQPGEFREVVSVFVSFKDISETAIFDEFATIVREEIQNFSGYFKEIDFGDKGGVMVGFFGAPLTFGDNEQRALEFISSLKTALEGIQKKSTLKYKAGVTSGLSFTGIIGGTKRCQYAAVGNNVNLAARLMVYADWGEILVDQTIRKTKGFAFIHKGDIMYKGFEGPVATYCLTGRDQIEAFYSGEMIGRKAELNALVKFARPIFKNAFSGVAVVYGEAGIGKSRLAYETRMALQKRGRVNWHSCQADQILQKPFNPFVYLFRNFFHQSPDQDYEQNKAIFEQRFQQLITACERRLDTHPELGDIMRELQRTKTVIAARLGLYYKTSLWSQLDAKGRYQNTISSFINLLKAEATITPFVLEVEDGHWFDDSTKALLSELVVAMRNYPSCIIITSRYREEDNSKPQFFHEDLPEGMPWMELDLNTLSPESIEEFAEKRLGGTISRSLKDLLARTTNGNPFYTEQVLEYFTESNLLKEEGGQWEVKDQNVKISGSINAVLMARIDRLSSLVKETVKAAAVIGREFEVQVLTEVMMTQRDFSQLNGDAQNLMLQQIEAAEKGQIWKAVNEISYIFKHSLLREAVYDMQIRTRLRELHRLIAETIERVYADQIDGRYADLAFHYEQAGAKRKMNEYLEKAGDYAKASFDNTRAILYYEKLANNLDHIRQRDRYVKTLLKKASILTLMGDWSESERVLLNAVAISSSSSDKVLLGRANNDLGKLLTLKGEYGNAYKYLQIAAAFFEEVKDSVGMGKVYGNIGDVFFRQGEYEKAKEYFTESLRISQGTDREDSNFGIVSNLGLALMNQGQYEEATTTMKPHLERCERHGNKLGVANISIYLGIVYFEKGDHDAAMECYQKGLKECEDLGNKFLTAIALGCMGNVLVKKGHFDTALELYERDLTLCRELGDKQGTAITLGLLGELKLEKGDFDGALAYLYEQYKLSEELNYQKGIASALRSIGDAHFHKRDYDLAKAEYKRAIKICAEIDNKRLLVLVLLQMVELSLHTQTNPKEIKKYSKQASGIAEELGNEELLFQTSIREAQVELRHGDREMARVALAYLLSRATTEEEKGDIYYVLGTAPQIKRQVEYRERGYAVFRALYRETPKYDYQVKMEALAEALR